METEDLDKILSKSYSELDPSEKEAIQEICGSEEEFTQLQQFFASVESYAQETREDHFPDPQVKSKLDDLFHETYQNKGILWYNAMWTALYPTEKRFDQRPLVRIAAILVVLISIVPFLDRPQTEKPALAQNSKTTQKEKSVSPSEQKNAESDAIPEEDASLKQQHAVSSANEGPVYIWNGAASDAAAISYEDMSRNDFSVDQMNGNSISVAGAATTFSYNLSPSATTYKWSHPDGIYMDTFSYDADEFTVNQNMAVLDLLTPTF